MGQAVRRYRARFTTAADLLLQLSTEQRQAVIKRRFSVSNGLPYH